MTSFIGRPPKNRPTRPAKNRPTRQEKNRPSTSKAADGSGGESALSVDAEVRISPKEIVAQSQGRLTEDGKHKDQEASRARQKLGAGMIKPGHGKTLTERFWSFVNIPDSANDPEIEEGGLGPCWEWQGTVNQSGYGQFTVRHEQHPAHRISFAMAQGFIAPDLVICHKCDNRLCVRPDHLEANTQKYNMQDMVAKGRHAMQVQARLRRELIRGKIEEGEL